MSGDNPLVQTHQYYRPITSAARGNYAGKMHANPPMEAEEEVKKNKEIVMGIREKQPPRNNLQGGYVPAQSKPKPASEVQTVVQGPPPVPKFQTILVERFRNKLKSRGGRGMVGLRRQFKIMDDNGTGTLDAYEFKKGIRDF